MVWPVSFRGANSARILVVIMSAMGILAAILIAWIGDIFFSVTKTGPKVKEPNPFHLVACPSGWLNYEGKCYFFSEEESSWTSSQSFCESYGSTMAVIESESEKVFVLRYMGLVDHWIGLQKDSDQTWKWADGTEFRNILEMKSGTGDCASLSTGFAMSSDCSAMKNWICSQPDAYTKYKNKRLKTETEKQRQEKTDL